MTLTQTGYYYKTYQKDPKYLKILVSAHKLMCLFRPLIQFEGGILIVRIYENFASSRTSALINIRSVLDTFHVICLSRGFWGILIKGRIDVSMVLVLSWFVCLISGVCYVANILF